MSRLKYDSQGSWKLQIDESNGTILVINKSN